jgi:hypothetical protein
VDIHPGARIGKGILFDTPPAWSSASGGGGRDFSMLPEVTLAAPARRAATATRRSAAAC